MLELQNISFGVTEDNGGGSVNKEILNDISLTVGDNRFVVITGPNGGGKSTLAKIIAGIEKPTSGRILLDGKDITDLNVTERAKAGISFAFQQPVRFKGIQVLDLIRLAAGKKMTVLYKIWRWYDDSFDKYKTPVPELADPDEHFIRITGTFAEVSNHGRIRDTRREGKYYNRLKNGTIRIMTNGEVLQKRGYQLVAEAFLPNPHGHKWIKFIDGDRTNWRADNLMWSNDYYGK